MELTIAQKLELIEKYAIDKANYQTAISTGVLTTSTTTLGTAIQGLGMKLKALALAHPLLTAIGLAAATAFIAFKGWDILTINVKEAKEALANARSDFDNVKSELVSINQELETNSKRINELNALPALTFVEKGELEKLQEVNKELERQKNSKSIEMQRSAEKLSKSNQLAFDKEFGDNKFQRSDVEELYSNYNDSSLAAIDLSKQGLEGLAAAILKVQKLQTTARNENNNEWLDSLLEQEAHYKNQLKDELPILQSYLDNLVELKQYGDLSDTNQAFYDNLEQGMRLISEFTDPAAWNTIEFHHIFNTEGIEVTKEQLISLAKAGKLDESTIKRYTKLNQAIEETDFITKNGENSVKSFLREINALARNTKDLSIGTHKTTSLTEQISLLDEMGNKFSSINNLYTEFLEKGTGKFSNSHLQDFVKAFQDVDGVNTNDFLNTLSASVSTAEDVQKAFDNIATQYIFTSGCLDGLTESTAEYIARDLEAKGITNAHAIVMNYLAAAKLYAAATGNDLTNATASEIVALLNEKSVTDETKAVIAAYALQKVLANDVTLATDGDIDNIKALMQACGNGTTAIINFQRAKANMTTSEKSYADTAASTDFKVNNPLTRAMAEKKVKDSTEAYLRESEQLQAAINEAIAATNYGTTSNGDASNKNSPGGRSNVGSPSPSTTSQTKEINWIDRSIKLTEDNNALLESKASASIFSHLGLTQAELDRAKEIMASTETLLAEDMQALTEIAGNAGMSLKELFTFIENGGVAESRRSYLAQVLENDKTLLNQHAIAVAEYGSQYHNAVAGLSEEVRNKIEYGSDSVDTYSGDEAEQIEKAINARDKYLDAKKGQFAAEQKYNKDIESFYQNNIDYLDQQSEQLKNANAITEAQINYLKESGQIVTAYSYEQLIANNKKEIALNEQKIAEKRKELAELMTLEGFSADSKEYAKKMSEINDYEESMWSLQTALQKTENELLNLPIENMDVIISMYESITGTIQRWGAEMEASGRKLSSDYYQSLINNGMQVIDQYKEQYGLVQNIMGEYQTGSDQWNKLYSKMQSINSAMSSMVENLYKWNEALLQMPLDSISTYSSSLQKVHSAMSAVQSDYDTVISAVTSAIEDEIDLLNKERDAITKTCDAEINVIRERLKLLNQQNEALQKQAAYEQALYDLQKANTQKTEKVIRDGEIVYETNADNLRSAQESVQDALFDLQTYELEKQLEGLETALDAVNDKYDEQISALEKISEKWSEISDKIAQTKNEALTAEILGAGWKDKVLSGNDEPLFQMFSGMYQTLSEQITQYEEQIESTDNISALLEDYINAYKAGTVTYDQAAAGINELLSQINQKMSAMEHLDQVFDFLSATTGGEANAEGILTAVQSSLARAGDELIESFQQYNENAALISEYTTSWQQLTENVSDIKDILADVRDNLEDALDEIQHLKNDLEDDEDKDRGVISSGQTLTVGGGGIASSYYTGGGGYVNSGPGVQSYAQGIRGGLLGENNDARRESLLKMISGQDLGDPSQAIPIIAHEGEAVLNRSQQDTLLSNFIAACSYVPDYPVPSYSLLSASNSQEQTNTFNFGGITIERCDSPDQLAEGILHGGLESAIRQSLGKYN